MAVVEFDSFRSGIIQGRLRRLPSRPPLGNRYPFGCFAQGRPVSYAAIELTATFLTLADTLLRPVALPASKGLH